MDAELCIALRPDWFRGWLRAALALSKLNMHRCRHYPLCQHSGIIKSTGLGYDNGHLALFLCSAAHTCINEAIEIDAALSPRKENAELQDALDIIREQQGKSASSVAMRCL